MAAPIAAKVVRREYVPKSDINALRYQAQVAKRAHKDGSECEGRCTECHFWSGTIAAFSELLDEQGVID